MENAQSSRLILTSLNLPRGDIPLPSHDAPDVDDLGRRVDALSIKPSPSNAHSTTRQLAPLHIPSPLPAPSSAPPPTSSSSTTRLRPLTNASASTSTDPLLPQRFRLIPASFKKADAFIVVPPPLTANAPDPKPLLFVGPALDLVRRPQRPIAKGTRVHPYRITRSPYDLGPPVRPSHAKTPQAI